MLNKRNIAVIALMLAVGSAWAGGWWGALAQQRAASAPAAWTPPEAASCLLWLDTFTQAQLDAGVIPDKSGNGHDLIQTNATKRGSIVDTDCIQGNGTSSTWTIPDLCNGATVTNHTIVAVCTMSSAGNKHFFSLSDYAASNWDLCRLGLEWTAGSFLVAYNIWHDTAAVVTLSGSGGATNSNYQIIAGSYELNNAANYINATLIGTDTSCTFGIASNLPAASTFLSYGATYFSDNKIKALFFFNKVLTTNDLATIKTHYGL